MKLSTKAWFKTFALLFMISFYQTLSWAQDSTVTSKEVTTSSTTQHTEWYTQPWLWVAGGAVFIILLVALLRGNSSTGSTDKLTVTKTVTRDSENV